MSDRYWVGGTATWDASTTSVWSDSSGGAGGASVPTSADNVFFDQAGTYTVSIGDTVYCANLTVSATTYTFQSTGGYPRVNGDFYLTSGTTWSLALAFAGSGSYTITTNGTAISGAFFGLGSQTLTLNGALQLGNFSTFTGTFNTNNYSLTMAQFSPGTGGTKTFNFGSSSITCTAGWSFTGNFPINFSAGAAIYFTYGFSINLNFGSFGKSYPSIVFTAGGTATIGGNNNTFQNISCTYVGAKTFKFTGGSTNTLISFNLRGTAGNLYTLTSTTTTPTTLKKAGTWYMGANSTDSGNNTNLTFSDGSGIDYLNVSYITGTAVPVTANFLGFF